MAQKDVVIRISGTDAVSPTFKTIAANAKSMGATVDTAGTTASGAMTRWSTAAQATGAAIGTIALLSAQVAGEAEASQARLEGAFANAGIAIDDYSGAIKDASEAGLQLAFDDEDVADSLAKLVGVTGNAEQAFADLSLAEDIARGANISLAAATDIVEAAEAGRFRGLAQLGIVLDETATKSDYLAAAQDKYAGSAERFAKTGAADFERWKNTAENALEAVGGALGGLTGPLLALSAGSTLIGTVGGALKETGIGAKLASAAMGPAGLAGAAIVAGAGLYLLSQRASEWEEAAEAAENVTLSLNDQIYRMATGGDEVGASALKGINDQWSVLAVSGAEAVATLDDVNHQIDILNDKLSVNPGHPTLEAEKAALVSYREELEKLALSGDDINHITEDIQNLFIKPGIDAQQASKDIAWYFSQFEQGAISAETLVAWIDESANDWTRYSTAVVDATAADIAHIAAMEKQFGAFSVLVLGIETAEEAMAGYKAVQDGLIASQEVYSQAISEVGSQLSAQDAAYEILNERKAAGIALTKEEAEFLENYAAAQGLGTDAVEDATVAQGLLAQKYLLNIEQGNALTEAMGKTSGAVDTLVSVIYDLILAMDGVPEEVRTRIELERAAEAQSALANVTAYLNGLDGRSVTYYVNAQGNGIAVGSPSGVGPTPFMDGGTVNAYANGATHYGGNWAIVGERGPEGVWLPNGAQVMNTEGSKSRFGGDGGITINGPITIVANNPQQLWRQIREQSVGSARQ